MRLAPSRAKMTVRITALLRKSQWRISPSLGVIASGVVQEVGDRDHGLAEVAGEAQHAAADAERPERDAVDRAPVGDVLRLEVGVVAQVHQVPVEGRRVGQDAERIVVEVSVAQRRTR